MSTSTIGVERPRGGTADPDPGGDDAHSSRRGGPPSNHKSGILRRSRRPMACPGTFVRDARQRRWRFDLALLGRLKRDDDLLERVHVDGIVIRRAPELALLRRRGVAERDAEAAADAEVGANGTDHPPIP